MKRKAILYGIVAAIVLLGCEQEVKVPPPQQLILGLTGEISKIDDKFDETKQILMAGLLVIGISGLNEYYGDMVGVGEVKLGAGGQPKPIVFEMPASGNFLPTGVPYTTNGVYGIALATVSINQGNFGEIEGVWAHGRTTVLGLVPLTKPFQGGRPTTLDLSTFTEWGDWANYLPDAAAHQADLPNQSRSGGFNLLLSKTAGME